MRPYINGQERIGRRAVVDELGGEVPEAGGADALGGRHLLPAAEAIAGPIRRPRSFHWPHGLSVVVTAREVRLESDEAKT